VLVRDLFETMGGLWVKLGQLLAMRRDLFPIDFCEELARLHDKATGFPGATARRILEEDLGGPLEDFFADFDPAPVAAASIGQTHTAVLHDGVKVAIKVQRPHIRAIFERDLVYMQRLFSLMDRLGVKTQFHWEELTWELSQTFLDELDYRVEASSLARMRRHLRHHRIYVPRVFHDLCSRRVLTMEYVEGVFMSEYIDVLDREPERVADWLRANEIEPERVGRRLYLSLLRQIFEDNLFHGDLHPGNILLLRRSRVALIDFGSTGSLESRFRKLYLLLNAAIAQKDYEKVGDVIALISPPAGATVDWEYIKAQYVRVLRQAEIKAYAKNMGYHERSLSAAMLDAVKSLEGTRIPVGWAFMRVDRAQITLDASLMYLLPEINYMKLSQLYMRKAAKRLMDHPEIAPGVEKLLATTATLPFSPSDIHLQGESLRHGAVSLRTSRRAFSLVLEAIADTAQKGLVVGTIVLGVVFVHQHAATSLAREAMPALVAAVPHLSRSVWAAVFGATLLAAWQLQGIRRRMQRADTAQDRASVEI
jgi:ubiquinone biosynthesis protein